MLCGYTPFWDSGSPMKIYENILRGRVKYPQYVNPDAQDLLERLITADLTKRLGNLYGGSQDVKTHPWFAEVTWDRLSRKDIDAPYTPPVKAGAGDASQFDRYPEEVERYGQQGHDEWVQSNAGSPTRTRRLTSLQIWCLVRGLLMRRRRDQPADTSHCQSFRMRWASKQCTTRGVMDLTAPHAKSGCTHDLNAYTVPIWICRETLGIWLLDHERMGPRLDWSVKGSRDKSSSWNPFDGAQTSVAWLELSGLGHKLYFSCGQTTYGSNHQALKSIILRKEFMMDKPNPCFVQEDRQPTHEAVWVPTYLGTVLAHVGQRCGNSLWHSEEPPPPTLPDLTVDLGVLLRSFQFQLHFN
jgi:serine/threonine protein kinase